MANADGSQHGASTYTTERGAEVCRWITEFGATVSIAAGAIGVNASTIHRWQREFPAFAQLYAQASAEAARQRLVQLKEAGRNDFRAASWWLERAYRDDFAPPTERRELTGADGQPLEVVQHTASPDDHAAIAAAILRRQQRKEDAT